VHLLTIVKHIKKHRATIKINK